MKMRKLILVFPIAIVTTLLITPETSLAITERNDAEQIEAAVAIQTTAAQTTSKAVGKVLGLSRKAKTITIEDKKLGNIMLKFDDNTKGIEHVKKDEAAIVDFTSIDGNLLATVIKPKLAKLPPGVLEIMPDELAALIDGNSDLMLIDSRPTKPYETGHIRTAVSIPVAKLETAGATLLPENSKDKLLLFYCGGPT